MIIRPASVSDSDRIGELWLDLVAYHQQLDADMPTATSDGHLRYAQRIRYSLNDSYQRVLIAEENEQIIGYVTGMIIDIVPEMFIAEKAGMIGDIYVQPSERGKGVGKALMDVMIDWFKLRGVTYYELSVATSNHDGMRFWQDTMKSKPIMMRMRARLDHE
jgi:GNAT superfamily N-acetyltransferase